MIFENDELASAVLFFSEDGNVSREMLYPEFQAILDAYVPAIELANHSYDAVYVEIDSRLRVRRTVFFLIAFTSEGFVDPGWFLPLEELARSAAKGPDLGSGSILLACKSSCPIEHYRDMLWDPDIRGGKGQFGIIKKVVEENRVGIEFRDSEDEESEDHGAKMELNIQYTQQLRKEYETEFRNHMAQLLKDQRLRARMIESDKKKEIEYLKKEHNARLNEFRARIDEKDRLLEEESQRNEILKSTIDGQAEKIRGLREYFEHKLERSQGNEEEQLIALKQNFDVELAATLESETKELKELLQMREVELLYRNEQEANLHDEVSRLRKENQELVGNSGDELLSKLVEKGISFVTYQPGAGHITLPVTDVYRFKENPAAYTAEVCGVTEKQYQAWLEHYHAPICRHHDEEGKLCGENINRVNNPIDFHIGESDRCEEHNKNKVKLKVV